METSLARRRSLWMRANGRSNRSATEVALIISVRFGEWGREIPFCAACVGGDDDGVFVVEVVADVV